jgi:hypothetical protein
MTNHQSPMTNRPLAKIRKYPETICVNRCLSARYLRLLYDSKIFATGLMTNDQSPMTND